MYMGHNPEGVIVSLHMLSAQAFIAIFAGGFMVLQIRRHHLTHVLDGFAAVGVLQGLLFLAVVEKAYVWPFGWLVFPQWLHLEGGLQGIFGNTAMAACVSAMTLPLVLEGRFFRWRWLKYASLFSALVVVYVAQSTMGFLLLLIAFVTWNLPKLRTLRQSLKWIFASIVVAAALGLAFDYQFFDLSKVDRFKVWPQFMTWWQKMVPSHLMGSGNGTFWFLGPIIQQQMGIPKDQGFWTWLHNDWLQLLFEEGWTGLVLGLNMFGFALYRSWKDKKDAVFSAMVTYGFLSFGMYPTNLAFTALFGMILVRSCFEKQRLKC